MNIKVLYFSPVGTTLKVVKSVAEGFNNNVLQWYDLTSEDVRKQAISFSEDDLVIMAFPVYAGRVARIPRYMFKTFDGNGARAVGIVTYGNRAYDDALLELGQLMKMSGFQVLGAGAFVCHHAFDIGLGQGRPNHQDVEEMRAFGVEIQHRMLDDSSKLDLNTLPGQYPPRTQFRHDFGGPLVPKTNNQCDRCMHCTNRCPVNAIKKDDPFITDSKQCITCYRCIRECHQQARAIELEDFHQHVEMLGSEYKSPKENSIFL